MLHKQRYITSYKWNYSCYAVLQCKKNHVLSTGEVKDSHWEVGQLASYKCSAWSILSIRFLVWNIKGKKLNANPGVWNSGSSKDSRRLHFSIMHQRWDQLCIGTQVVMDVAIAHINSNFGCLSAKSKILIYGRLECLLWTLPGAEAARHQSGCLSRGRSNWKEWGLQKYLLRASHVSPP